MKAFRALVSTSRLARAALAIQSVAFVALFAASTPAQQYTSPRLALQSPEPLPAPTKPAAVEARMPAGCERVPPDPPLSALSADMRPRNQDGQVVPSDQLPTDCAKYALGNEPAQMIVMPDGPCGPSTCELLQLARFCHKPLYFNDECLERYGVRSCCVQPAASAARFYGGALLMPARALYRCPCNCVSTPPCYYGEPCY